MSEPHSPPPPKSFLALFLKQFLPITLLIVLGAAFLFQSEIDVQLSRLSSSEEATVRIGGSAIKRIVHAVAEARRDKSKAAVMFIDLDGFKAVNDTMGHGAGDALLKAVSDRLLSSVREVDTVARNGGDEFVIVLVDVKTRDDVSHIAEKVITLIATPFRLPQGEASIGASIGISLCPDNSQDPEELLQRADKAMYHVKSSGKSNFFFSADETS